MKNPANKDNIAYFVDWRCDPKSVCLEVISVEAASSVAQAGSVPSVEKGNNGMKTSDVARLLLTFPAMRR
jgi:hypothetical protein